MNAPLPPARLLERAGAAATQAQAATAAPAAAAPVLIGLHDAAVRFGPTTALSGINLGLQRGQRLALIGPNGSGKTTLLRLLHGLQACSEGQRLAHPLPESGRPPRMAMLFQRPFLLQLSVQRNLQLALWLAGVGRTQRAPRVAQALQRVGLQAQAARPATALSGGQQQRLALARAWALQPDILFLDEPTASLDPGARGAVEALVEDLGRRGATVVMSTHHLGQARRLATHVAYLEAGCLHACEPVERFFNGPLPPRAAAFLRGEHLWN